MKTTPKCATFIALLVLSLSIYSSQHSDRESGLVSEIKAKFETIYQQKKGEFSAMSYSLFNTNGIIHSEGFGTTSRNGQTKINPGKSLFRFSSISKLVTTAAIAQLVESKQLSLETSIMDLDQVAFIKFLKKNETKERLSSWRLIKIKHLLSHQAGISKDLPGAQVFWNSKALKDHSYPSFKEFRKGLLKVKFLYPAGQTQGGAKYSNLGMNLLARIVECVNKEGLKFSRFVTKNIFKPINMKQSFYDLNLRTRKNLVRGYGTIQKDGYALPIPNVYNVASYDGAIGVASTLNDMAKFGTEIIKASHFMSNKIFTTDSSIKKFLFPKKENSLLSKSRVMTNGLFWRFRPIDKEEKENLWLGFTGFGYAFESILLVNPKQNIGLVIAINSTSSGTFPFWDAMVEILDSSPLPQVSMQTEDLTQTVQSNIIESESKTSYTQKAIQSVTLEQLEKFQGPYFADNMYASPTTEIKMATTDNINHLIFHGRKIYPIDIEKGIFSFEKKADVLFNGEPAIFNLDVLGNVKSLVIAEVKELTFITNTK